jgi:hypothetical protein
MTIADGGEQMRWRGRASMVGDRPYRGDPLAGIGILQLP